MNKKNSQSIDSYLLLNPLEIEKENVVINQKEVHPCTLLSEWIGEMDEAANREKFITNIDKQALTTLMKLL